MIHRNGARLVEAGELARARNSSARCRVRARTSVVVFCGVAPELGTLRRRTARRRAGLAGG